MTCITSSALGLTTIKLCGPSIIYHWSNILCININYHPNIYISSIQREYQVSHNLPEWWCSFRYITLKTTKSADNNYYYYLVKLNSCLYRNHTLSLGLSFKYIFWTLLQFTSRPLRSYRIGNILLLYINKTGVYIIKGGLSTLCLSATNLVLCTKPSSRLLPKIICDFISLHSPWENSLYSLT